MNVKNGDRIEKKRETGTEIGGTDRGVGTAGSVRAHVQKTVVNVRGVALLKKGVVLAGENHLYIGMFHPQDLSTSHRYR